MPTNNQIVKLKRKKKNSSAKAPGLLGCPQKKATCLRVF